MWYGPNLQRSYKYMMFASKMPSLRIDQSDLKCKNGCDYYGNPQWQGYCSKCHREQMQRQRRAEKWSTTLPKSEQKKSDRSLKLTSRSSFSKFEEKRLRQSETLKKANLLKFTVFKKSADDHDHTEKKPPEFKIPSSVYEGMKREFRIRFPALSPFVEKDSRVFVHSFIMDVIKYANLIAVDELSERVQRQYQHFMKYMETSSHFTGVPSDTKELLMDFVEKHAMTYLHELPSVVFSPAGTEDERADRAMSERIQQLSWVGESHLECRLNRNNTTCCSLLYKAIGELLGMDSAMSPGGKLARVRRCCRHVLALCAADTADGTPPSADDLLPALIFTVLKANPPRLVSNINFVSRFCNAQRLMTGEGGYYFTNLCCAVSFIENLTAESLSMDKKEFDCYMAMPASIGGSAWAAALSLCAEMHEAEEQRAQVQQLAAQAQQVRERAEELANNALTFQEEISKKVEDVLEKTPLKITPRRELPRVGKLKEIKTGSLIDIDTHSLESSHSVDAPDSVQRCKNLELEEKISDNAEGSTDVIDSSQIQTGALDLDKEGVSKEPTLNILGFEVIDNPTPPKSPQNLDDWDIKQTNSMELLTPSPLGFTPFDSRSIDELMTPDEFGSDQLAPGLSNINYDIDLSDLSGDNSLAEDSPKPKDPFSPEGIRKSFNPFAADTFEPMLDRFDQFSLIDANTNDNSAPFEVIRHDPFGSGLVEEQRNIERLTIHNSEPASILDDSDSPTTAYLLPSPLQPQSSKQT